MNQNTQVQLAMPKGRMFEGIKQLLADAGCPLSYRERDYRVGIDIEGFSAKLLKPQGIVEMLGAGRRDVGFAGADWVAELNADLIPLLDTQLDPVSIVAAAPEALLEGGRLPSRPLVVASEYCELTTRWMREKNIEGTFVRSWGATEVLPPEDADCIIDNTATGSTLRANGLAIIDTLMTSSTRLYASRQSMENPSKRKRIQDFVMVLRAVLDARKRVMLEFNLDAALLPVVLPLLPAMREPTIARLQSEVGVAVRAAVPRANLASILPSIKAVGGTDIVVSRIDQIVV